MVISTENFEKLLKVTLDPLAKFFSAEKYVVDSHCPEITQNHPGKINGAENKVFLLTKKFITNS